MSKELEKETTSQHFLEIATRMHEDKKAKGPDIARALIEEGANILVVQNTLRKLRFPAIIIGDKKQLSVGVNPRTEPPHKMPIHFRTVTINYGS